MIFGKLSCAIEIRVSSIKKKKNENYRTKQYWLRPPREHARYTLYIGCRSVLATGATDKWSAFSANNHLCGGGDPIRFAVTSTQNRDPPVSRFRDIRSFVPTFCLHRLIFPRFELITYTAHRRSYVGSNVRVRNQSYVDKIPYLSDRYSNCSHIKQVGCY